MRRREVRRASRFKGLYCQSAISRLLDNKSVFRRVSKQPERMSRRDGIDFTDQLLCTPNDEARISTTLCRCRTLRTRNWPTVWPT